MGVWGTNEACQVLAHSKLQADKKHMVLLVLVSGLSHARYTPNAPL